MDGMMPTGEPASLVLAFGNLQRMYVHASPAAATPPVLMPLIDPEATWPSPRMRAFRHRWVPSNIKVINRLRLIAGTLHATERSTSARWLMVIWAKLARRH